MTTPPTTPPVRPGTARLSNKALRLITYGSLPVGGACGVALETPENVANLLGPKVTATVALVAALYAAISAIETHLRDDTSLSVWRYLRARIELMAPMVAAGASIGFAASTAYRESSQRDYFTGVAVAGGVLLLTGFILARKRITP